MIIDDAIEDTEAVAEKFHGTTLGVPREIAQRLALLRFVREWGKTAAVPMHEESWNRLCKARAAVDLALNPEPPPQPPHDVPRGT